MARKKREAHFFFTNKDGPDYVGFYGTIYTDRQLAILNGEIPLDEIRPNELSFLYKKAKLKGDMDSYEEAMALYQERTTPSEYVPTYTIDKAKEILQALTPWKIKWEK